MPYKNRDDYWQVALPKGIRPKLREHKDKTGMSIKAIILAAVDNYLSGD
jgi:hypothetical protein|tara:strand:- start:1209 stop:1355 length:147 start_codon:yes stop_codon:yes gene_type:complete